MLDDTKLKNCGLRNASKFPLNENVNFNEPMILCDESYGRNVQFHLICIQKLHEKRKFYKRAGSGLQYSIKGS